MRVLLKLSGEALSNNGAVFNSETIDAVAAQIVEIAKSGVQVGVVIGAGNIWRGRQGSSMDRVTADHMGMLATILNSLAMKDAILRTGNPCCVMTSIPMESVADTFAQRKAIKLLNEGTIVIFGGGTGNPFFSTDTAAALRAAEISADTILLAKNIDGVYDSDPRKNANAKMFASICYQDVLARNLGVMDSPATALCMENNIPLHVFALNEKNSIKRIVAGEKIGTVVAKDIETVFCK